jgi:hypothetical protein
VRVSSRIIGHVRCFDCIAASWLRISYLFGTCLNEQLRALRVFLQSSTGNKYLAEFLDVGGLFTLLEILNVQQIHDDDKQQAVRSDALPSDRTSAVVRSRFSWTC